MKTAGTSGLFRKFFGRTLVEALLARFGGVPALLEPREEQQIPFGFAQGRLSTPHRIPFRNGMVRSE
jgi:hypothetical protein